MKKILSLLVMFIFTFLTYVCIRFGLYIPLITILIICFICIFLSMKNSVEIDDEEKKGVFDD